MARTQGSHSHVTAPRIRDAALRLFATHGYAAVSMRQIGSAVGVQAGALYNYTPDKQTLLFDLLRAHMEELLSERGKAPRHRDPKEALRAFARFHIEFHAQRPDEVFISYMELRNLSDENFQIIEDLRRRYEAELEAILAEGVAQGVFAVEEPRIATMAIIGMLTGVTTWYRPEGRLSLEDVVEVYGDMILRSVLRL